MFGRREWRSSVRRGTSFALTLSGPGCERIARSCRPVTGLGLRTGRARWREAEPLTDLPRHHHDVAASCPECRSACSPSRARRRASPRSAPASSGRPAACSCTASSNCGCEAKSVTHESGRARPVGSTMNRASTLPPTPFVKRSLAGTAGRRRIASRDGSASRRTIRRAAAGRRSAWTFSRLSRPSRPRPADGRPRCPRRACSRR